MRSSLRQARAGGPNPATTPARFRVGGSFHRRRLPARQEVLKGKEDVKVLSVLILTMTDHLGKPRRQPPGRGAGPPLYFSARGPTIIGVSVLLAFWREDEVPV